MLALVAEGESAEGFPALGRSDTIRPHLLELDLLTYLMLPFPLRPLVSESKIMALPPWTDLFTR